MMGSTWSVERNRRQRWTKNPPVRICQPDSAAALAASDDHLLPEDRNLRLKRRLRSERRAKKARTNPRSPIIPSACSIGSPPQSDEVFGTDSPIRQCPSPSFGNHAGSSVPIRNFARSSRHQRTERGRSRGIIPRDPAERDREVSWHNIP
jgi:hypothetical protein